MRKVVPLLRLGDYQRLFRLEGASLAVNVVDMLEILDRDAQAFALDLIESSNVIQNVDRLLVLAFDQ